MKTKKIIANTENFIQKNNLQKPLLYAGGGVLLYFLILKPILRKIGFLQSKEDEKHIQNIQQFAQKTQSTQKLTYPIQKYNGIAQSIHNALFKTIDNDDEENVYSQFRLLNNMADLAQLIKAFGFRHFNVVFFNTGQPLGLAAFLRSALNKKEIHIINTILQEKNIHYAF